MKKQIIIPIIAAVVFIIIIVVVYSTQKKTDTHLIFSFRDKVSKDWVWDASCVIQNRTIHSYYQSDKGIRELCFSNLEPGSTILYISAPGYKSEQISLNLKKGENRIEAPIELEGLKIEDLNYFFIFEALEGADINIEIRPVNSNNEAILNHPCLNLWIGVRVSIQMTDSKAAEESTDTGSVRGEELFQGQIQWDWDPLPETVFRYSAVIPGSSLKNNEAKYRVIDYLIIIPGINAKKNINLESIVREAWEQEDLKSLYKVLDNYSDTFSYYIHTSWNVKGTE